jgi:excisionase family DNA binding protein
MQGTFPQGEIMNLLNIEEAANELRSSPMTVQRLVKAGAITCLRLGSGGRNARIFFTPEVLAAYLKERTVPAKRAAHE